MYENLPTQICVEPENLKNIFLSGKGSSDEPLHKSFGDNFLEEYADFQHVYVFDNVEAAKSFTSKVLKYNNSFITVLYRMEGEELSKHSGERIYIGLGYSDFLTDLQPQISNPSAPLHPIIYSDAARVGTLIPEKTEIQLAHLAKQRELRKNKIEPLTASHVLPVAYIAEKAYQGTGLGEPLNEMQNNIIGAQHANQIYGQKKLGHDLNLSSVAFDDKGVPAGFFLAYPATSEYSEPGILEKGAEVIYVHDIAVREGHGGSGRVAGGLLLDFLTKWAELGDVPVLGDVRDATSYPMLKRAEQQGYITITELRKDRETTKVLIKRGPKAAQLDRIRLRGGPQA